MVPVSSSRNFKHFQRKFNAVKKKLILVSLRGLPFSVGKSLRQIFYRFVLPEVKHGVEISPGVSFQCPGGIHLGSGVKINDFARLLNYGVNSKIYLRDQVVLSQHVEIKGHAPEGEGATIDLGHNTYVGPYSSFSGKDILVGENCLIGPYVGIFANQHVFEDITRPICEQGNSYAGIVIGDNCWLGTGVKVLDGVTIGTGSVVGAGSVVTHDLPPYSVAVGVPAKVIRKRTEKTSAIGRHQRLSPSSSLSLVG